MAPKGCALGSRTTEVAHWAPRGINNPNLQSGQWVMTGSAKNPINYLMSGVIERGYPLKEGITTVINKSQLKWPSGMEWIKGLIGQRQIK
jgi:hypothetical protein